MVMAGFFYYVTYKYVLLKDARLGVLYYLLAALILLYTVVEIFVRKGYMQFDTKPQGTVKLMLSDDFANETFDPSKLPYCQGKVPCQYVDPWDLNWPIESRAVTITTFAKDRLQHLQNSSNSPLDEYEVTEERNYFTQGPEYVVIKIDHAVVASLFTDSQGHETLAASHRQLRGFLINVDGDVMKELSPEPGKPDKISIKELMEAAGVDSLDQESDAVNAQGRTIRERGCILRVTIHYQNWFSTWLGTREIEYRYHVRHVPYIAYSMKQVQSLASREEAMAKFGSRQASWRILRKIYALRVEFEQAGSLGMFSLPILLLKLVSGMGLLTLTATVIDTLALYVLPDRGKYRKSVYEESPVLKQLRRERKEDKKD